MNGLLCRVVQQLFSCKGRRGGAARPLWSSPQRILTAHSQRTEPRTNSRPRRSDSVRGFPVLFARFAEDPSCACGISGRAAPARLSEKNATLKRCPILSSYPVISTPAISSPINSDHINSGPTYPFYPLRHCAVFASLSMIGTLSPSGTLSFSLR